MSFRIWKEIADQKKQVENQRAVILSAFKRKSVEDQVGMIKAEKLFKPITKLLGNERKEDEPVPDYDIDEQTRNFKNELPFGEGDYEKEMVVEEDPYADLKPFTEADQEDPYKDLEPSEGQSGSEKVEDYSGFVKWLRKHGYKSDEDIVPLPEEKNLEAAKPMPGPEEITPLPVPEELEEEVFPGEKQPPPQSAPSYSEATKDDKPPKYKEPGAAISAKKSKFLGYTVANAKTKVYGIYTGRAKEVLKKGDKKSAIGQKDLGPYEGKSNEEMQAMIDAFEQEKQSQTGTGFNNLINRLSLGISSIVAGNTSIKLRKEIASLAKLLHQKGILSKEQKNKVLALK